MRAARALVRLLAALIVLLAGAGALLGLDYARWRDAPVLEADESAVVVIPPDSTFAQIARSLAAQRLVDRPWYLRAWARRTGLDRQTRPGTYRLEGPLDLDRLAEALRAGGEVGEVRVVIPEGFSIFRIADRLDALGIASRSAFLAAARDPARLTAYDIPGHSMEGYLFPDTYRFERGTPADAIVERMHERWREAWAEAIAEAPERLKALRAEFDFDEHDVITLASLIERETAHAPERALIARVFYNRLRRGMRLQTDPSCVYGEQTYREVPTPKRCKDPLNAYSTYVIDRLPPGPIANPGRAAIAAALEPSDRPGDEELLFFVARRDGSGAHRFSATFRDHKRAIREHLTGKKK